MSVPRTRDARFTSVVRMTRTAQLRLDLANNNSPITSEISRQVDSDRHKHDKSSVQTYGETEQPTTDGRRSSDKIPRGSQSKKPTSQRYGEKRSVTTNGRNHQMKSMTQQRSKSVATNSRLPRPDKVSSRLPTAAPVSSSVKKHNPSQSHTEPSPTAKKETRTLVPDPKDLKMDQSDIKRWRLMINIFIYMCVYWNLFTAAWLHRQCNNLCN